MKNLKHTQKELNVIYRNYIMGCILDSDTILNEYGIVATTEKERILFVLNDFVRVANHPYNIKKHPNVYNRLAYWFMGLPYVINIDFENYKIIELCKFWGVLPENTRKKQEDTIINDWFVYMAIQLLKTAKYYKVDYSFIY